jgi:hypothetical protein
MTTYQIHLSGPLGTILDTETNVKAAAEQRYAILVTQAGTPGDARYGYGVQMFIDGVWQRTTTPPVDVKPPVSPYRVSNGDINSEWKAYAGRHGFDLSEHSLHQHTYASPLTTAASEAWTAGFEFGNAQPNPWKQAVLDALANAGLDAPLDEAPASILKRVIDAAVQVATDSALKAPQISRFKEYSLWNSGKEVVRQIGSDGKEAIERARYEHPVLKNVSLTAKEVK